VKAIECLIVFALLVCLSGEACADAATGRPNPAVPVSVAAAARADVPVLLGGIGTVQAFNTVTIRTQVDGQLTQVLFTEGQKVSAGDVLAIIDPRLFQAAYDEATAKTRQDRAALADAQAILAREADLAAKSYTPTQTVDTQRATVDELTAQIAADQAAERLAATNLAYTRITSPIGGVTGIRLVDVGNILHPSDPAGIVVVTQMQPISVVSTLPEQHVNAVRDALAAGPVPAVATDRAGGRQLGTGTVAAVDNEIDTTSGTIRLKSTFPNRDGALWPGLFVNVAVQTRVLRGAVTVPPAAVQRGPGGFFVYVVADGVARVRAVRPGQMDGGAAVIESGLAAGDVVVTEGQYRLADGTPVSTAAGTASASPPPAGN
jgi:multidrug efflux system membrane fusion protein